MAGDFERGDEHAFRSRAEISANRLRININAVIEKYNKPFDNDDVINLSTLSIHTDRGAVRGLKGCHKFGTAQLKSTKRKDELLRSQIDGSKSHFDSNVSMAITRQYNRYLRKPDKDGEPSDAESLDSDSSDVDYEEDSVEEEDDEEEEDDSQDFDCGHEEEVEEVSEKLENFNSKVVVVPEGEKRSENKRVTDQISNNRDVQGGEAKMVDTSGSRQVSEHVRGWDHESRRENVSKARRVQLRSGRELGKQREGAQQNGRDLDNQNRGVLLQSGKELEKESGEVQLQNEKDLANGSGKVRLWNGNELANGSGKIQLRSGKELANGSVQLQSRKELANRNEKVQVKTGGQLAGENGNQQLKSGSELPDKSRGVQLQSGRDLTNECQDDHVDRGRKAQSRSRDEQNSKSAHLGDVEDKQALNCVRNSRSPSHSFTTSNHDNSTSSTLRNLSFVSYQSPQRISKESCLKKHSSFLSDNKRSTISQKLQSEQNETFVVDNATLSPVEPGEHYVSPRFICLNSDSQKSGPTVNEVRIVLLKSGRELDNETKGAQLQNGRDLNNESIRFCLRSGKELAKESGRVEFPSETEFTKGSEKVQLKTGRYLASEKGSQQIKSRRELADRSGDATECGDDLVDKGIKAQSSRSRNVQNGKSGTDVVVEDKQASNCFDRSSDDSFTTPNLDNNTSSTLKNVSCASYQSPPRVTKETSVKKHSSFPSDNKHCAISQNLQEVNETFVIDNETLSPVKHDEHYISAGSICLNPDSQKSGHALHKNNPESRGENVNKVTRVLLRSGGELDNQSDKAQLQNVSNLHNESRGVFLQSGKESAKGSGRVELQSRKDLANGSGKVQPNIGRENASKSGSQQLKSGRELADKSRRDLCNEYRDDRVGKDRQVQSRNRQNSKNGTDLRENWQGFNSYRITPSPNDSFTTSSLDNSISTKLSNLSFVSYQSPKQATKETSVKKHSSIASDNKRSTISQNLQSEQNETFVIVSATLSPMKPGEHFISPHLIRLNSDSQKSGFASQKNIPKPGCGNLQRGDSVNLNLHSVSQAVNNSTLEYNLQSKTSSNVYGESASQSLGDVSFTSSLRNLSIHARTATAHVELSPHSNLAPAGSTRTSQRRNLAFSQNNLTPPPSRLTSPPYSLASSHSSRVFPPYSLASQHGNLATPQRKSATLHSILSPPQSSFASSPSNLTFTPTRSMPSNLRISCSSVASPHPTTESANVILAPSHLSGASSPSSVECPSFNNAVPQHTSSSSPSNNMAPPQTHFTTVRSSVSTQHHAAPKSSNRHAEDLVKCGLYVESPSCVQKGVQTEPQCQSISDLCGCFHQFLLSHGFDQSKWTSTQCETPTHLSGQVQTCGRLKRKAPGSFTSGYFTDISTSPKRKHICSMARLGMGLVTDIPPSTKTKCLAAPSCHLQGHAAQQARLPEICSLCENHETTPEMEIPDRTCCRPDDHISRLAVSRTDDNGGRRFAVAKKHRCSGTHSCANPSSSIQHPAADNCHCLSHQASRRDCCCHRPSRTDSRACECMKASSSQSNHEAVVLMTPHASDSRVGEWVSASRCAANHNSLHCASPCAPRIQQNQLAHCASSHLAACSNHGSSSKPVGRGRSASHTHCCFHSALTENQQSGFEERIRNSAEYQNHDLGSPCHSSESKTSGKAGCPSDRVLQNSLEKRVHAVWKEIQAERDCADTLHLGASQKESYVSGSSLGSCSSGSNNTADERLDKSVDEQLDESLAGRLDGSEALSKIKTGCKQASRLHVPKISTFLSSSLNTTAMELPSFVENHSASPKFKVPKTQPPRLQVDPQNSMFPESFLEQFSPLNPARRDSDKSVLADQQKKSPMLGFKSKDSSDLRISCLWKSTGIIVDSRSQGGQINSSILQKQPNIPCSTASILSDTFTVPGTRSSGLTFVSAGGSSRHIYKQRDSGAKSKNGSLKMAGNRASTPVRTVYGLPDFSLDDTVSTIISTESVAQDRDSSDVTQSDTVVVDSDSSEEIDLL